VRLRWLSEFALDRLDLGKRRQARFIAEVLDLVRGGTWFPSLPSPFDRAFAPNISFTKLDTGGDPQ
jgi:hypothetical protein